MTLPLSNITVLDLCMLLPGPFCSMIMADFGARVVKIERLGSGDLMRDYLPRYPLYSGNFAILNRNKESMTLNLRSEEGKSVFRKLAERSDILIESFRPGVMDRLGLGYEDLSKINKGLIYCSISGFGQESPYRNVAGHDVNYIGLNGMLDLVGKKDEPPELVRQLNQSNLNPEAVVPFVNSNRFLLLSDDGSLSIKVAGPHECLEGEYRKDGTCQNKYLLDPDKKTFRGIWIVL